MNNNTAGDAASARAIEDIAFQASILALHTAIESAGKCGGPKEDAGSGRDTDDQLNSLMELVRRPDQRGF